MGLENINQRKGRSASAARMTHGAAGEGDRVSLKHTSQRRIGPCDLQKG